MPFWQIILVLFGMPALYIANSLLPWSVGLFQQRDHAFFLPFWSSVALLHWSSVVLVLVLLKRSGRGVADIGLNLSPLRVAFMAGIPLITGLTLTALHESSSSISQAPSSVVLPSTMEERLFWIFMSLTAGFCEELVYRGFGIRTLQGRNVRTWLAVVLANLAFFFLHGISALSLLPFITIYIAGLLFSILFLWRRSLLPGICLHALIDVVNIGVP